MFKLNIPSIKILSIRSGVSENFLQELLKNRDFKNQYIYDHDEISEPEKNKFARVAKKESELYKFHLWLDAEIFKNDHEMPLNIVGGISKKSLRDAVKRHNRNVPFCFIKSDLKRFFESTPAKEIFSLFCWWSNCSKKVTTIITNSVSMPLWPVWSIWDWFLARWFNPSTRIAIWTNIDFFRKLSSYIWKKYKKYKPIVTFFIDDIGISLITVDQKIIDEIISDVTNFIWNLYQKLKHLSINLEKTKPIIISNKNDHVDYLGTKIYMNKIEVSDKIQNKIINIRKKYLQSKNQNDKKHLWSQLTSLKHFKNLIKWVKK